MIWNDRNLCVMTPCCVSFICRLAYHVVDFALSKPLQSLYFLQSLGVGFLPPSHTASGFTTVRLAITDLPNPGADSTSSSSSIPWHGFGSSYMSLSPMLQQSTSSSHIFGGCTSPSLHPFSYLLFELRYRFYAIVLFGALGWAR
jgi:hypothetical protein